MLDAALQLAGRGWRVFPCHSPRFDETVTCSCARPDCEQIGKHPRIKAWQKHATTDRAQIEQWWRRWPDANVGVATGGGIVVVDLDGATEARAFREMAEQHGGLPATLTARTGRGAHLYLGGDWPTTRKLDTGRGAKVLVRGSGGYVLAPPSRHASGATYAWVLDVPIAPMPDWFINWLQITGSTGETKIMNETVLPPHLQGKTRQKQQLITKSASNVGGILPQAAEIARLKAALFSIPATCERDPWLHCGMALHALNWETADGTDLGFELWHQWSATGGDKFQGLHDLETRWTSFGRRSGGPGVTIGTIFHLAEQHGWTGAAPQKEVMPNSTTRTLGLQSRFSQLPGQHEAQPPSADLLAGAIAQQQTAEHANGHAATELLPGDPTDPARLIDLNAKYCAIGDVGGKCMVLGWNSSPVDRAVQMPSFQSFKAFQERYAHIWVPHLNKQGDLEPAQLGALWLKWRRRRTADSVDLDPTGPELLPGNALNLWRGWGVQPAQGKWPRMRDHLAEILADGDSTAAGYIARWAAWSVQHPGECAEVALVLRGQKGAGKGAFGHALRRMFGQHGLHVSQGKHLVGSFNAHLRSTLLLYADEAFWAGDKQGESALKALITENVMMLEQKGMDAVQWRNRLHIVMTANADWVVPASHDERRYAVFKVSNRKARDENYFGKLNDEMRNGGLGAMLWDLQHVELGDWHPRRAPETEALREQKIRSMRPLEEWWEAMLQDGAVPGATRDHPDIGSAAAVTGHFRDNFPRVRDQSSTSIGRFLSEHGCSKVHRGSGNCWKFPPLGAARSWWEREYRGWIWENKMTQWARRD